MKHKASAKDKALNVLRNGNCTTAHTIARAINVTPQHCNRVLKQLFMEGKITYAIVEHRGKAKLKRRWVHVNCLAAWEHVYPFETPLAVQMELPL